MPTFVKAGGVWKDVSGAVQVRVDGVWRLCDVFVRVGGVWKKVTVVYALPSTAVDYVPTGTATATVYFSSNGTFSCFGANLGQGQAGGWVSPTLLAPGSYTIRASLLSGTTPSGSALDTDLALTSDRSWSLSRSGPGTTSCQLTLTLKDGGGNTVATSTCSISAQTSF